MRGAFLAVLVLLAPASVHAYQIGSVVSNWCHETITLEALADAPPITLNPPEDPNAVWWRLGDYYAPRLLFREPTSANERLVLATAVIGIRSPDLGEYSLVHITNLREVHLLDPHQVRHFLRTSTQDGTQGGYDAVDEGRAYILALVEESAAAYDADPNGEVLRNEVAYVERYGPVEVPLWRPLYLLARALHALQDSFTHTYRTDDSRRILAVQNYVEAVTPAHDEERDGPRHSDALDDCTREDSAPLVEATKLASTELAAAVQQYWIDRDITGVERVLDDWFTVQPGCTLADGYCGSRWVAIAKSSETHPLLGCAVTHRRTGDAHVAWILAAAIVVLRRRKREHG